MADTKHTHCFHCGLPVPPAVEYSVDIDGQRRPMCCPGCQAVAQAIINGGYGDYYHHRTETAHNPSDLIPNLGAALSAYDQPEVQKSFVREPGDGLREASLILEGITCAACSWLNEHHLRSLAGVREAHVNYSTDRAWVTWDPDRILLSDILGAIQHIGYVAHPYNPERREQIVENTRKQLLKRIGVAAALGIQVMMIAVAMYFGEWHGISWTYENLFRWVSLILTVPILFYAASPFFIGAWRDVQNFQPGMDVPVALGIAIASAGSAWATWQGSGQVYFESVAMFVFFLLTARYFELVARQRSTRQLDAMTQAAPDVAERIDAAGDLDTVLARELRNGDRIRIFAGANVPADGRVITGNSSVSETLLTGESRPIEKRLGDRVLAGSVNLDQPMEIEVTGVGDDTVLSQIVRLVERVQLDKPRLTRLSDRVATGFVIAVLCLAVVVGMYWWHQDPSKWLAVTVSVLVITCPCALSLAMPTAQTTASNTLASLGIIATAGDALERLARVDHMVFDKTGTLTLGEISLSEVRMQSNLPRSDGLSIAAALEAFSQHPLAKSVISSARGLPHKLASQVVVEPGGGVSGLVDGKRYHLGKPEYVLARTGTRNVPMSSGDHTVVLLADDAEVHGEFLFTDHLRNDASETIRAFAQSGIRLALYSGDHAGPVNRIAGQLAIHEHASGLTPEQKLSKLRDLQANGNTVAMVGDGINDAPVLSAAQVSIAMGGGTDLARTNADFVLLNDRLYTLVQAFGLAKRTMRVVRQNIAWALAYNLLALPAAAVGMVPPWLAALGMSASSLLVVGNALRLRGRQPTPVPTQTRAATERWTVAAEVAPDRFGDGASR
jgi:Cu2+-exporting ATPase